MAQPIRNGSNPWMARYVYGFMFLIANLLAWAVRDYGGNVLTEMERYFSDSANKHNKFHYMAERLLSVFQIRKMPNSYHATCNYRICFMLNGDHIDVHMVCPRTILPPQHFLHYLDLSTSTTHDHEPSGESCNKKAEASNKTDWLTIISFVIAVLAMVIATFSTGIDSKCFQFRKDETESEDDVPYGYGFFHFVFATGAMYFAMLLIGWNTHQSMKNMDAGCSNHMEEQTNGGICIS
ncbi:Serinc-domain containing serine and sphingolipid biosynthesis protein [Prunus dulcis]|uniref:Serinc-domain containing serine and sphingolipid biosynthesis protein n=1 Tax=Prunus dulcis TaxID=3755 RepID=A0A4Y1RVK7_PRUDU|nr:Serinc-domain containing serine and sphingolipid biosynthesis protein [Prunus dulcis]